MKLISRQTKQKELILNKINEFNSLFSAEELFTKIKKIDSNIGIATIYRFLKYMKKMGKLHSYTCERKTLYSKEENSHCHFICEKCQKLEHIRINNLDFLKKNLKEKICHFQINLTGICKDCLKTNKE